MIDQAEVERLREEFQTAVERVEELMEKYPSTRDNRQLLCILYWKIYDGLQLPYIPDEVLCTLTPLETITRAQRKVQNDAGILQPSPEVREKRARRESAMRVVTYDDRPNWESEEGW